MSKKNLSIPAGMIALGYSELLKPAVLSILLERLVKGNAEVVTLESLADRTGATVEAVEDALQDLVAAGAILCDNDKPWSEVSSIAPKAIQIEVYVGQYRLGDAGPRMRSKPHRYQTGEDEVQLPIGDVWKGVCVSIGDGESFEIQITKTHEGRLGSPDPITDPAPLPQYVERFETLELAWLAFDEYVKGQSTVMGWAAALKPSNPEKNEVLLDAATFGAALAEIEADPPVIVPGDPEFDFLKWLETASFERRFEIRGRSYIEHSDGERFPRLVEPAADETPLGEARSFVLELADGEKVAVCYVESHTPAFSQMTFTGAVCESGEHVKQFKKSKIAEAQSPEAFALDYAEGLRARFTKGQNGGGEGA